MEAGGGSSEKRLVYPQHLKKVLRSYQAAATTSLHGPNSVIGVWQSSESDDTPSVSPPNPACTLTASDLSKNTFIDSFKNKKDKPSTSRSATTVKDIQDYDPLLAPPPFPIQQPPIFTPADQTRCEKSETILESETIACFNVGGEERLCLPQILNTVLRDFSLQQINCVCDTLYIYCSRCNQDQLDVLKASGILPCNAPSCGLITKTDAQRLCAALLDSNPMILTRTDMKSYQIQVYHECFGRCSGLYMPDLFQHPLSPCIECVECHALLSPQKFVCHVHHPETRTCHWGFDVYKWRAYILLEEGLEDNIQLKEALKEMKERFGVKFKRKQILEESIDPSQKRVHVDNYYPYQYSMESSLVYYYNANPHLWNKTFQACPSVITKDGNALYFLPETSFPHLIQKSMHLQHPLIAPAHVQKVLPVKLSDESTAFAYAQKAEALSKRPIVKKDPDRDSIPCLDSEDAFSDTSFSTLSAGTEDGLVSNLDDEDELHPSTESQFLELKKILTDVDVSLRTKIMSEVETLIAKYRKCLNVAVQGKKLYQMELEKINYRQRAKLRKLHEKNKNLEKEIEKLRSVTPAENNEQSESQNSMRVSPDPSLQSPAASERKDSVSADAKDSTSNIDSDEKKGDGLDVTKSETDEIVSASSSLPLPKQPPDPESEPLGK